MPELPEVETIVRSLRGKSPGDGILNHPIYRTTLSWEKALVEPQPALFSHCLLQKSIGSLNRRGKFLVFDLAPWTMLIHLRMSGDLRYESTISDPLQKHDHLVIEFDNHTRLVFNDPRKFGRIWLTHEPEHVLSQLGPEPLDEQLTQEKFYAMLQTKKQRIKPLLLNQSFIAGLGNIYTTEALFRSKIHPLTPACQLTKDESGILLQSIRNVLEDGIRHNGSSIDWAYRGGNFQNHFSAYGREDQPCPACGNPITREIIGQRSTYLCPVCQPQKVLSE